MSGTSGPGSDDVIAPHSGHGVGWAPHNKRMHATADTQAVKFLQSLGAARDARRWAAYGGTRR